MGEKILTFLKSPYFSTIRIEGKPQLTFNSVLLILEWPGTSSRSGQWSGGGLTSEVNGQGNVWCGFYDARAAASLMQ